MKIRPIDLLKDYIDVVDMAMVEAKEKYPSGMTYPSSTAKYFGVFIEDKLVGFFGMKSSYFRSAYVVREHRRKGIYKAMVEYAIGFAATNKNSFITVVCTEKSLPEWIKYGAFILKKYRNGNTKIKLKLLRV